MRRGVVFDLYETLVTELDPEWVPPSPSLAERLGVSSAGMAAGWQRVREARMRGVIDFGEALAAICRFERVAAPSTGVVSQLVAERRVEKAKPFARIDDRVTRMLEGLREDGFVLCVISNASEEETQAWSECVLAPFFDVAVFSYAAGFLKPERELYELGCARLGLVPSDAVFVGDGGADELVGARDVGLGVLWATWFLDAWPVERHSFVARASEFRRVLRPEDVRDALASTG